MYHLFLHQSLALISLCSDIFTDFKKSHIVSHRRIHSTRPHKWWDFKITFLLCRVDRFSGVCRLFRKDIWKSCTTTYVQLPRIYIPKKHLHNFACSFPLQLNYILKYIFKFCALMWEFTHHPMLKTSTTFPWLMCPHKTFTRPCYLNIFTPIPQAKRSAGSCIIRITWR